MKMFKSQILLSVLFISFNTGLAKTGELPTLKQAFSMEGKGKLNVFSYGGDIDVIGIAEDSVKIFLFVKYEDELLKAGDSQMDQFYEYYDLRLEKLENEVSVSVKPKGKLSEQHFLFGASIKVIVPKEMDNKIHVNNGNVKVYNQSGVHKYSSNSGNITLTDTEGPALAVTSNGDISLSNHKGNTDLRTSLGKVITNSTEGDMLINTSGGEAKLSEVSGNIEVYSSGGNVNLSGRAKALKAITSGGAIVAKLDELQESLYLNSTGGNIEVVVPSEKAMNLNLRADALRLANSEKFNGELGDKKAQGTINGGGIRVEVFATGGRIDFSFFEQSF